MFCPKCGSQNTDDTKFCRGCGASVGNVLAVVDGHSRQIPARSEKHVELYSSAVRWLIFAVGFLIVSGVSFAISIRLAVLGVFALAFGFLFLGTGIARLVQAKGLRSLAEPEPDYNPVSLTSGSTEFVSPPKSIYETDDLLATPHSVTDHTTKHLHKDPIVDELGSSKLGSSKNNSES